MSEKLKHKTLYYKVVSKGGVSPVPILPFIGRVFAVSPTAILPCDGCGEGSCGWRGACLGQMRGVLKGYYFDCFSFGDVLYIEPISKDEFDRSTNGKVST